MTRILDFSLNLSFTFRFVTVCYLMFLNIHLTLTSNVQKASDRNLGDFLLTSSINHCISGRHRARR